MLFKLLKDREKGEEEEREYVSETSYELQSIISLSLPLEKKHACLCSRLCSELGGASFCSCPWDIRTVQ